MNQDKPMSSDERIAYGRALNEAGRSASRAGAEMDTVVADFLGVNATDARCLDVLDHFGSMSAGELAEVMALTSGAVTTMVDRLERANYVTRTRDVADRRRVVVAITDDARSLTTLLFAPFQDLWARHGRKLTDDELRAALSFTILSQDVVLSYARLLRGLNVPSDATHADRMAAAKRLSVPAADVDLSIRRERPFPLGD